MKIQPAVLLPGLITIGLTLLASPAGASPEKTETSSRKAANAPAGTGAGNSAAAAALLDLAIWWPGDLAPVGGSRKESCSFEEPPFPAFGTMALQENVLSKTRIAELNQNRAAVVAELVKRLGAFDWEHFPAAPEPGARVAAKLKKERAKSLAGRQPSGPWKPENSLAPGAAMLRIIEATDAVETLPELLRLEGELNLLNEAALQARRKTKGLSFQPPGGLPVLYVPPIEVGGTRFVADFAATGKEPEIAGRYAPGQPGEKWKESWLAWETQVFANLVFQREILGVCLGLLEKKGYEPLAESGIGSLAAGKRRIKGLVLMEAEGIRGEADLSREQRRRGWIWDTRLGVPRQSGGIILIPWSADIRDQAGRLVRRFIRDTQPKAPADGATLLEDCIASPGDYNQMCLPPELLPSPVPMPFRASLVPRHFLLTPQNVTRLQASRNLILPVLAERLRTIRIETPAVEKESVRDDYGEVSRSGQNSRSLGPILLEIVEALNAVECLPDLLRLEQDLDQLIARAKSDAAVPLPDLILDSPSAYMAVVLEEQSSTSADGNGPASAAPDRRSPEAEKKRERATALITCKIYQRELLGLMKTLLLHEDHAPMKSSSFVKAQQTEGRRRLLAAVAEVEVTRIKSAEDIRYDIRPFVTWDAEAGKIRIGDEAVMPAQIPLTPAIRSEIRTLTEDFLNQVPPEKRKAGAGMGPLIRLW